MVGRVGPGDLELTEDPSVPERAGPAARRPPLGRAAPVSRGPARAPRGDPCRRRPGERRARFVGDRLRPAGRGRQPARRPVPLPRRADRRGRRRGSTTRSRPPPCTSGPGCSSCRSTRSTSWRPLAGRPPSPRRGRCCSCRTCSATGCPGVAVTEVTNASTTGLLDVHRRSWDTDLMAIVGLPPSLFTALGQPGDVIGPLRDDVRRETGAAAETVLTLVGSHDTASAVVGVPGGRREPFAYIACGTWGLVGVELDHAVLSEASRIANFTNEGGVDDRIRYLRNVMGLWLLQESMRTWELDGSPEHLTALAHRGRRASARRAAASTRTIRRSCRLATCRPGSRRPAGASDQPVPTSRPALVRCILDSLAAAFGRTVREAATAVGTVGRRRPPGRWRRPELAAVPADRRRLRAARRRRTGRGHRARQRARPGPGAWPHRRRPRSLARARPRDPGHPPLRAPWLDRAPGRLIDARRAVRRLLQRPAVPGRRSSGGHGCCAGSGRTSSSRRARRAAARCTSTPATRTPASHSSRGSRAAFSGYRRRRDAVRLVRVDGPPPPSDGRVAGGHERERSRA